MERAVNPPPTRGRTQLLLRRGLLLAAAAVMVVGLLAGLARLGLAVGWGPRYWFGHGPLMVFGVFATIIALERAVALGSGWAFAAPVASAASASAMLAGLGGAPWLASGSSAALVCVNAALVRRQPATFTGIMLGGSVALLAGAAAWAFGRPVFDVVPTWIAFYVLTIAGERLELSRLTRTPRWATRALTLAAILLVGAACVRAASTAGPWTRLSGLAVALIGAWQLRFDVARRTVRQRGLPRLSGLAILLGSVWLLVAGALLMRYELPPAGPLYDAVLHAVFVGYVLSMVFAHAPIILPAVARVRLAYHPSLWLALAVLHLGLAVRTVGDLAASLPFRQLGGIANVVALVLFAAAMAYARVKR